MKKLLSIFEITRPVNLLFTVLVVFVAIIICSNDFIFNTTILLAISAAGFVTAAGNIINDYFDFEIDKINRPKRTIPSGRISKKEALILFIIFSTASLILSFLVSIEASFVVIITLILLFFYSAIFKGIPFLGNVIVALCTSLAFIFGGMVVQNIGTAIIPAVFAFEINLIREILKDIDCRLKKFPICLTPLIILS